MEANTSKADNDKSSAAHFIRPFSQLQTTNLTEFLFLKEIIYLTNLKILLGLFPTGREVDSPLAIA